MKNKKIAIIYSGAKYWGGIETYLSLLFENANKKELDLLLICMGDWPLGAKIKEKGGSVAEVSKKRINYKTIFDIRQILRKEKADLVVSQGMVACLYARLAVKNTGIPNLITVHSYYKYDYPHLVKRLVFFLLDKTFRKKEDKYIAVSNFLKNKLIAENIGEKNISVIYNAVESHGFKEKNSNNKDNIVIGSIGRLHKVKGFDNLIKAINLINNPKIVLKIWGEGEERKNLEDLIKRLGLEKKVFLEGYVEDLAAAYNETDIYVQPSLMEGFGIAAVEAMSFKKPVVVTPVGSLPEIVKHKKTGLISLGTDPEYLAQAINIYVEDKGKAKEIGENAYKDVKDSYSAEEWIKKTTAAYLKAAR